MDKIFPSARLRGKDTILKLGSELNVLSLEDARHLSNTLLGRINGVNTKNNRETRERYKGVLKNA